MKPLLVVALALMGLHSARLGAQEVRLVEAQDLPPTLSGPYEIQVGDVLDIGFFKTPIHDQTRTVGPDGEIHLPLVGRVNVAGRTVDDVTRELTERYSKEMVEPQITLSVREFSGLRIYVGGEVLNPGMRPYRGGVTIVQAIMEAGGFRETAGLSTVVLIRKGPDNEPVGSKVNVKDILNEAQFGKDVTLAPSDIVFVPRSRVANLNLFIKQFIQNNFPVPVNLGFFIPVSQR